MKDIIARGIIISIAISSLVSVINYYVILMDLTFVLILFTIFSFLIYMIFLLNEISLFDKSENYICPVSRDKDMIFKMLILFEGMVLIECTGIILSGIVNEVLKILSLVIWEITFLTLFVTSYIETRTKSKK